MLTLCNIYKTLQTDVNAQYRLIVHSSAVYFLSRHDLGVLSAKCLKIVSTHRLATMHHTAKFDPYIIIVICFTYLGSGPFRRVCYIPFHRWNTTWHST